MNKIKNDLFFLFYTLLLGAIVGAIICGFLKVMNLATNLLWEYLPEKAGFPLYTLIVCTVGGLLIGLWKKKFGDKPEELGTVIKKIKTDGRYSYSGIFPLIGSALFPLVLGASVGPEAGLTGIISGLCTWVGDKLKKYSKDVEELTAMSVGATLGTIFRSPMFGFIEPIESERGKALPKRSKLVLYFAAILSSFGTFVLIGELLGMETGFESLELGEIGPRERLFALPMVIVGVAAGYAFFAFKKLCVAINKKIGSFTVIKGAMGGLILGVCGTFLPLTMFSGEHQIPQVMEEYASLGVLLLVLTAFVKLLLTNVCIETGLKGGHFFPVIFSGICLGAAFALAAGLNAVFCAAVVTSALVSHTLKKPFATVLLLMIVFPPSIIPIMLAAAAAAAFIPTPKIIAEIESE